MRLEGLGAPLAPVVFREGAENNTRAGALPDTDFAPWWLQNSLKCHKKKCAQLPAFYFAVFSKCPPKP
jgi:hypothetical protein